MAEGDTGCHREASRTVTVSTPDHKVVRSVNLCQEHGQAASNDRTNAKLKLDVKHEFVNKQLGSDPEKVREMESDVRSLLWEPNSDRMRSLECGSSARRRSRS